MGRSRRGARESGFTNGRGCGKSNVVAEPSFAPRPGILRLAQSGKTATLRAMSLHRCFSTLGCAELSLDEALRLAAKHRIGLLELRALGGTLDLAAYFSRNYASPAALAERLRASPVRIVAFDSSLRLFDATEAGRAEAEALAPWAQALGARWLRVFDGGRDVGASELAAARQTLAWWQALQAKHGWNVDLMVETHDALITAAAIQRLAVALPALAVLWDAHHTWRKGGEDPVTTWEAVRASAVHVHVKDSIGVPSARHPFTYVVPGDGGFPIAPLRAVLERDGFPGAVSLEWERQWHDYLPPLDEALRVAAERGWW